jgi:hypothetical protein
MNSNVCCVASLVPWRAFYLNGLSEDMNLM